MAWPGVAELPTTPLAATGLPSPAPSAPAQWSHAAADLLTIRAGAGLARWLAGAGAWRGVAGWSVAAQSHSVAGGTFKATYFVVTAAAVAHPPVVTAVSVEQWSPSPLFPQPAPAFP